MKNNEKVQVIFSTYTEIMLLYVFLQIDIRIIDSFHISYNGIGCTCSTLDTYESLNEATECMVTSCLARNMTD